MRSCVSTAARGRSPAEVLLLHPPIAPWLIRAADGCRVTLLCRGEPRIAYLRAEPDNEELLIAMQPVGAVHGLTGFEAELPWDRGNETTHYAFKVIDGRRQRWLAADGVHPHPPSRELHFKVCRAHTPPAWVADQIVYQIFPDRFCRRCFDWDRAHWNAALHAHYRRLIGWRKARPEWRRGAYQTLAADGDALVFARYTERSVTLVAVNRGAAPVVLPLPLADLPLAVTHWHGADGAARSAREIAIPPAGFALMFGDA